MGGGRKRLVQGLRDLPFDGSPLGDDLVEWVMTQIDSIKDPADAYEDLLRVVGTGGSVLKDGATVAGAVGVPYIAPLGGLGLAIEKGAEFYGGMLGSSPEDPDAPVRVTELADWAVADLADDGVLEAVRQVLNPDVDWADRALAVGSGLAGISGDGATVAAVYRIPGAGPVGLTSLAVGGLAEWTRSMNALNGESRAAHALDYVQRNWPTELHDDYYWLRDQHSYQQAKVDRLSRAIRDAREMSFSLSGQEAWAYEDIVDELQAEQLLAEVIAEYALRGIAEHAGQDRRPERRRDRPDHQQDPALHYTRPTVSDGAPSVPRDPWLHEAPPGLAGVASASPVAPAGGGGGPASSVPSPQPIPVAPAPVATGAGSVGTATAFPRPMSGVAALRAVDGIVRATEAARAATSPEFRTMALAAAHTNRARLAQGGRLGAEYAYHSTLEELAGVGQFAGLGPRADLLDDLQDLAKSVDTSSRLSGINVPSAAFAEGGLFGPGSSFSPEVTTQILQAYAQSNPDFSDGFWTPGVRVELSSDLEIAGVA